MAHPDAKDVVAAETRYARAVRRVVGAALGVAALLVGVQLLLTWLTWSAAQGPNATSSVVSPATLTTEQGGTALLLLLPSSIALQVLLRMPRDHENVEPEDAIAHRQFWGRIAAVVALAAGFVALSTFAGAAAVTLPGRTVDVVQLFGVPTGAALTLLIAADAATQADLEAVRLSLASTRSKDEIARIRRAVRRVPGAVDPHPKRSLTMQAIAAAAVVIGAGTVAVHAMIGEAGLTAAYAFFAATLCLFAIGTALQVIPSVLRSKILDTVGVALPPAMVTVVIVLEGATTAMPFAAGPDWGRYLIGLAYGLLLAVPPILVVAVLVTPRGRRRIMPPLLAVSRSGMCALVARLEERAPRREPDPWRVFAAMAMLLSILPPVSLVLAVAATWQRRHSADRRRGMLVGAWVIAALVLVLELAALALLPWYGAALGWFTLE